MAEGKDEVTGRLGGGESVCLDRVRWIHFPVKELKGRRDPKLNRELQRVSGTANSHQ